MTCTYYVNIHSLPSMPEVLSHVFPSSSPVLSCVLLSSSPAHTEDNC